SRPSLQNRAVRRSRLHFRRVLWTDLVPCCARLYRLEGLQMRLKPPRRRVTAKLRDDRTNATGPNQVWAIDWMHDELFDGCRLWVLTESKNSLGRGDATSAHPQSSQGT